MEEKISDRRSRSIQYQYNQNTGVSDKNHLEDKTGFRKNFSVYSIEQNQFISQGGDIWDRNNLGGIPVDYDKNNKTVYVDSTDAHTLLIGATGSKKSRLVIMPAVKILAAAGECMIISDPKSEIYQRTAVGLKEQGYSINVINLRNPKVGNKWNFLSIPYEKYLSGEIDKACEMINDAAVTLMPITSKDPYWDYSARDLFVGLSLLLFKICRDKGFAKTMVNMRNLLDLRVNMFSTSNKLEIKRTPYWKEAEKDELIKTKLMGIVVCPNNTLSCILSTFDQHVSCFSLQPKMIEMLSETTIDLDGLGLKKSAVFIIIPDEKTTYHKLVTVFIKQIYEYLIDKTYNEQADNRFPIRINFVLDEFSSLPCIKDFPQMIAAARSRNIRFHLIMQSKKQLQQRYEEEAETIQSNCTNWLFLHTREIELLKEISQLAGNKGKEDLIPVSNLQHLDKTKGECLIFSGRLYPYLTYLADIDEYDSGNYQVLPMEKSYAPEGADVYLNTALNRIKDWNTNDFFSEQINLNLGNNDTDFPNSGNSENDDN